MKSNRSLLTILSSLLFVCLMLCLTFAESVFAYDASVTFKQSMPELVSGFYLKAGPTKGGPYLNVTDCGKPVAAADGTFECIGKNYTANPLYAIVSNYDSTKKEIGITPEASLVITVPPPSNVIIKVLTVTTVSTLSRYGNPIAKTTIKWSEASDISKVREGTRSYRNDKGEYITNTIIAMR